MRIFISLMSLVIAFSAFSLLGGCGGDEPSGMQAPDYGDVQPGTQRRRMPGPTSLEEPPPDSVPPGSN